MSGSGALRRLGAPQLPGASAFTWTRRALILERFCLTPAFLLGLASLLIGAMVPVFRPFQCLAVGLFLLTVLVELVVIVVILPLKESREVCVGYTSLQGRHSELPQVASETNIVVREPGSRFLDRAEFISASDAAERQARDAT